MDASQSQSCKGKEKVETVESLSQENSVYVDNKRRREETETEPNMSADVGQKKNPPPVRKIRDAKGWEHGIMINENKQHWKCKYCSIIGHSGGVYKLKHHLVGTGDMKKCPNVPEHVSTEIKHLMDAKRQKRAEKAAQKGASSVNIKGSGEDDAKDGMPPLPADSNALARTDSRVPEGVPNQTNGEQQQPTYQQAVTISESKAVIRLDIPLIQLIQPDATTEVPNVHKDLTCNHCGKEARDGSGYCQSCSSTFKKHAEGSTILLQQDQTSCLNGNSIAQKNLQGSRPPAHEEPTHEEAVDNSRAIVVFSGTQHHVEIPEPSNTTAASECCKICGGPETEGKRFLICGNSLCPYKCYHIWCMTARQVASDAQSNKPCWHCPSCLCRGCLVDRDDDLIILCDGCDEAFHIYCLRPPRTSIPEGDWFCSSCSVEIAKEGGEYERRMLKLHRKDGSHMMHLVDVMLSAAEELKAEEHVTKKL